jgi:hypothetical protein
MSTAEERIKILNMVAEGKITAEEGAELLKALRSAAEKSQAAPPGAPEPRYMRVRVTSMQTDQVKVNITIPMSLIDVGLRMGARFAPDLEGLDFEDVMTAIRHGQRGRILDVEDEDDGERVEIFVE